MAIGLQQSRPQVGVLANTGVDRKLVKAIDEFASYVSTLFMFANNLNTLSKEGFEGIARSLAANLITAGLADLGIPLDELAAVPGEFHRALVDEIFGLADSLLMEDVLTAADPRRSEAMREIKANQSELERLISGHVEALFNGTAILNGLKTVRNTLRGADPIIIHRGEFERSITDLQIRGAGINFTFHRTYRSSAAYFGPLGPNWDHSYNLRLRQENEYVLVRLTGQLSEQRFVQHPRFGHADFSYFVPPDGVHDVLVLVPDGDTFLLRRPQGVTYHYQATGQPGEHRIERIEDRFGNYLRFIYTDEDRLNQVFVNSPYRYVIYEYDEVGRLVQIRDHEGRRVHYTYDDWGFLDCVSGPIRQGEEPARLERYEYDQVVRTRKLARVLDWQGRIIVENEYELNEFSDFFGYVIRQAQNRGETSFFYEDISHEIDPNLPRRDAATLRVWEYRRNGHQVEHWLNASGNELMKREHIFEGGRIREAVTHYRYNADGQIIAKIDPDGVLTQFLYGRDHVGEDIPWPDIDPVLGDVSQSQRMSFGNLLATVTRGERIASSGAAVDPSFWTQRLPSAKQQLHADDVVAKYRYHLESQLLLSKSDPRFTISADPLHVESAAPGEPGHDPTRQEYIDHQRLLTRFEYGPQFELRRTILPDRTYDGVPSVTNIIEKIDKYDANGRPLERIDARGYRWFSEYYSDPDPKEGYLRRQLFPHLDLLLNNDLPDILEVQRNGNWQATGDYLLSGGAVDDHIVLLVEGVRIALYQSSAHLTQTVSGNAQVAVSVDGNALTPWDQTQEPTYIISDLAVGSHQVEIRDTSGDPVAIGRVRTHVAIVYEVDDLGRVLKEIDARGNETVYIVDVLGRNTKVTSGSAANPSVIHYEYDQGGKLVLEREEWRDETGVARPEVAVVKRYCYDQEGLLLSESVGTENGDRKRLTRHRYDSEDNRWETVNPRGNRTYFDYDALARQIRTVRAACSPDISINTFVYDLANRLLAHRNPRQALRLNGYIARDGTWQSGIDTRGRVRIQIDPLGHLTVTDYDKLDNPTVIRLFQHRPDGQFEMLSRQMTKYDEYGDVIRTTEAIFERPILTANPFDPQHADDEFSAALNGGQVRNATTEFYLDAHGNTEAIRNPDGGFERKRFDGQGRVYEVEDAERGRTFSLLDGNGNILRNYDFDPVLDANTGNISHYEVFLRLYEYDALNREVARLDPYDNRWQQDYDTLGNLTRTVDPLGNVVLFRHNAFGEEVRRTEERTSTGLGNGTALDPFETEYLYDEGGNLLTIIDPARRRTEFRYDALDRRVKTWFAISPNEPKEFRTYDPAGNLTSITDRNGLIKTMQYDLLDRHVRTDIDAAGVAPGNELSPKSATFAAFDYDAAGRLIHHENNYCIVELHLDSRGLASNESITIRNIAGAPGRQQIGRGFDGAGRRTKLVYPSGRELLYTYNKLGRITSIRNLIAPNYPGRAANAAGFDVVRLKYIGQRLVGVEMGNNLTLFIRYDGRGRVLERSVIRPRQDGTTELIWRNQRLRDAAGFTRIESATMRHGERSRKFSLDSIYRLTHYEDGQVNWIDPLLLAPPRSPVDPGGNNAQAQINAAIGPLDLPSLPPAFEFDEMGNRLNTREAGLPPFGSVPNPLNQYAEVDGTPWRYDANGNLRGDGEYSFAYDLDNALQEILDSTSGETTTYWRDALGRVVTEETIDGATFRINDGGIPLVELDMAGWIEYTLDHLSEIAIHSAQEGEDYWITRDVLGSLRLLTDFQGTAISIPIYLPFGSPENGELAINPLRLGFGAMWFTPGFPFHHSQRRSYRTDLGCYLQRDPIGQSNDLNAYAYVGNNPVDRWDPTGLEGEPADVPFLQVLPKPPLSLSADPREFELFSVMLRPDLSDFQKQLVLDELTGHRAPGGGLVTTLEGTAPILLPKLPTPQLIYTGLLFNLLAPVQGAMLLANPVAVALELAFSEVARYGTKQALVAGGVSEQASGWISAGVGILAGTLSPVALKSVPTIIQNRIVGTQFENYVQFTKLRKMEELGLLDTQLSIETPHLVPFKFRVRTDFGLRDRIGNLAAIADAKTSSFIPFDLQARAFVEAAQGTTTRQLIYYVPGPTTIDNALISYAQMMNVKLRSIIVP